MFRRNLVPLAASLLAALLGRVALAAEAPPAAGKATVKKSDSAITAKRFSLAGSYTLARALAEVEKLTGNHVEDRRTNKSDDKLGLDLNNVTFWQALDLIARDSDSRLDLYQSDGVLAFVDGPYREQTVSYDGIFRTVAKRISSHLDLDADAATYEAQLEVTWEPRFRPFFAETRPESLVVKDDKDHILEGAPPAPGRQPVDGRFVVVDLRLPPVQRSVKHLNMLKGKVVLLGPKEWLTFTFDDLKVAEQTREGVSAKLSKVTLTPDLWSLEMTVKYPDKGPSFESFESWLVYNEIRLVKKDEPNQRFPNNGGFETGNSSGTKASLTYHFVDDPKTKFTRGKPDEWKVVYKTPGQFVEVPAAFEFKDVRLP
jgi:hypothetical protein